MESNDTGFGCYDDRVWERGKLKLIENFNLKVSNAVTKKFFQTHVTAQTTLRLFFHDCFIQVQLQGCDASIMIFSPRGDAERDAPDNLSLAGDGFDTVIKTKQAVEAQCPGIVSCADILALSARDTGEGPSFSVELGRRDGLVSKASDVAGKLPEPNFSLAQLVSLFANHNLKQQELIALSGAHTIGVAHCSRFANRIYNFPSSTYVDPSLNPAYTTQLMLENVYPTIAVPMDPQTPLRFDNLYFQDLVQGKGMFSSDEVLFTDSVPRPTVVNFAANQSRFFDAFFPFLINQLTPSLPKP
ncbi:Peroxidase 55-like protein [Drosera capensis]